MKKEYIQNLKAEHKKDLRHDEYLKEKARKISVKEASAYSFMDGFGLRYITPYALALGANTNHIGLLTSLPSLIGNFAQLLTLRAMKRFSRRKIVFTAVFLQAIMWLFIIAAGSLYFIFNVKNNLSPMILIIIYTLLITFGALGSPAWSSWMKDIVTQNRGNYFGKRSMISGIIALICMLIAGFILDYFKKTYLFLGFSIIFFIAFLGRFVSSGLILKQYEPDFKQDNNYYFSFIQFLKRASKNNFGRFVIYFSLISLTTAIASPFFAVYMLKNLNFSYISYMSIILSSSLTSLIFIPAWGKFADKYGNLKVMKITGIFVPVIPFLWLLTLFINTYSGQIAYLLLVEGLSGIIWAGFNLSAGNFIYDAVTEQRMAICVSYFSILAGIGVVIGASLGGFIASKNIYFLGFNSILIVFLLSAMLRLFVYFYFKNKIKEVRRVEKFSKSQFSINSIIKFFDYLDFFPVKQRPT